MKKLVLFLLSFVIVGCASLEVSVGPKNKQSFIEQADLDVDGGADAYASSGDHDDSIYYANPDYYNLKNSDTLTILENFQTFQQTTEYTCGAASALMIYNYFALDGYTEETIAYGMKVSMDSSVENAEIGSAKQYHDYGTDVKRVVEYFNSDPNIKVLESSYVSNYSESDLLTQEDGVSTNDIGNLPATFSSMALYTSENSDDSEAWVDDANDAYFVKWVKEHLDANHGIMVEWGDWDGHWVVIIGYDTMGTPDIGDDMLIFADPYDTADHWQDGYTYIGVEKFFYMWADRNVAPKPFQLQPYVVIEKSN